MARDAENVGKSSAERSQERLVYRARLHNKGASADLNSCKSSKKTSPGVSSKRLHNRLYFIVAKRGIYHVRRRVPSELREALGKGEIWRSLATDSRSVASRRALRSLAEIEALFDDTRGTLGLPVDFALSEPWDRHGRTRSISDEKSGFKSFVQESQSDTPMLTFSEVYSRFMNDATQDWSPRTRLAYETTRRLALSIIGSDRPIEQLTRVVCRDFLDTLRFLPKRASRAFPALSAKQAAAMARETGFADLIGPSNVNTYLNKLCVVLNWAVIEGYLSKNNLKGLRVADPVNQRDKRLPFDEAQLEAIFSAPLYTGCLNDGGGYAICGPDKPRGTRFWVPLLGLYTGMRLNEICQLDTTDLRVLNDVLCIIVCTESQCGSTDKRLKTASSARIIPLHPRLLSLGFESFVLKSKASGRAKLFEDINPGSSGIRSTAFSKWFVQYLCKANASKPRTSFHSFRHSFRDALREARVDREIAMALGGWGTGSKSGLDVSDFYGRGFDPSRLREEITKIKYDKIKALTLL